MGCPICRDMERAIECRHAEYVEARFTAYFRFCTKLAARRMVELERAKNELVEHRQVCTAGGSVAHLPEQTMLTFPQADEAIPSSHRDTTRALIAMQAAH